MGWFSQWGRDAKPLSPDQEKTASSIAEKILVVQTNIAAKLNTKAKKIGRKRTLILLGALMIGFAVYLFHIMVNAIF